MIEQVRFYTKRDCTYTQVNIAIEKESSFLYNWSSVLSSYKVTAGQLMSVRNEKCRLYFYVHFLLQVSTEYYLLPARKGEAKIAGIDPNCL